MKYLDRLTTAVEQKIEEILPDKFAIVFDGWTGGDAHYIALFATFPDKPEKGYSKVLLAFTPFFLNANSSLWGTEEVKRVINETEVTE